MQYLTAFEAQYILGGGLQAKDFFAADGADSTLGKSGTQMIPVDKFALSVPGSRLDERIMETRFKKQAQIEDEQPRQRQKIMTAEDFAEQVAEEDFVYEPLQKYPTLVVQVDLFKGHGGNLGLKFEDPDTTIIESFIDPVMKRWGWRVGDEIVAILYPMQRTGDKVWRPTENFDALYKRFARIKEDWKEFAENRRLYFGIYRPHIPPGEKYPPIPKALHQITQVYLDDRGSDFDSSSDEEYWKLEKKEAAKKPRTMPRADWLRYAAWKWGKTQKTNTRDEEYALQQEEREAIRTGEGKYWQDVRNKSKKQEIRWVKDSSGRERIHTMQRGLDIQHEKKEQTEREKRAERKAQLQKDIKAKAVPKKQHGVDFKTKMPPDERITVDWAYGRDIEENYRDE